MGSSNSKLRICSYCRAAIPTPPTKRKSRAKADEIATAESNSEAVFSDSSDGVDDADEVDDAADDDDDDDDDDNAVTVEIKEISRSSDHLPPSTVLCPRCHGLNGQQTAGTKPRVPADRHSQCLDHLHIAPFADTLRFAEEKELETEFVVKTYLRPYFKANASLLIRAPHRLSIKGVEFKVLGCYPPTGYVSAERTNFHLSAEDGALNLLTFEPLQEIHLLPTAKSLETYHAIHGIVRGGDDDDGDDRSNRDLHRLSLRPYLKGSDEVFYVQRPSKKRERKTSAPEPASSTVFVSDEILFGNGGADDDQKEEEKATTASSLAMDKRARRHLCDGETFVSFGIQWRAMRCVPSNGFIDSKTKVVFKGKPLADCESLSIRPIYESVPFSHRNFTPKQYKMHYLDSWFLGTSRYIGPTREVTINGVTFAVRGSVPRAGGVVTALTEMDYLGMAIKAEQLQAIRAMEDEEMAQELQRQMRAQQEREMARLRRQRVGGLRGRWSDPLAFEFPSFEFPWTQPPGPPPKARRGVDQQVVDRLPTFDFADTQSADQCRICLEFYCRGEELRMLPCFHRYHRLCVDRWLTSMSSKCPICKTSILQRPRARR